MYGDSVFVHGAALNAIRLNWDQLRKEFTQLDPYRTGYVQSEEFDDISTELCPAVNQEDLDMLKFRFQTQHDPSYAFLYNIIRQRIFQRLALDLLTDQT